MELINKQAALDIINSYGGADATDPEDKRSDNLVGHIYADVDSIEPVVSCTDEVAADWDYCPGCGRRVMA